MVTRPKYTNVVSNNVIVEPLSAASVPEKYLKRFPEEVYNTSSDSNLFKLIFTLIGPSGVGSLKKDFFNTRLQLEANGFKNIQLEKFYGNVFKFFKILDENQENISGESLTQGEWAKLEVKDASYRNRAIDYLHAARLGNTPDGMRLAAKSGLGKDVEIVENYRYLFDIHSDDPIGEINYGTTDTTSEFVVLPHYETDQSYTYSIKFNTTPNSGFCYFTNNNDTTSNILIADLTIIGIQSALKKIGLTSIVQGDSLSGFLITIQSKENLVFVNQLYENGTKVIETFTTVIGNQDTQLIQDVAISNRYDVDLAINYLKPVGTFVSYAPNQSSVKRQAWYSVISNANQIQVLRFVTGSQSINWPAVDNLYWIEPGIEKEAPRVSDDNRQHYQHFHEPAKVNAYRKEDTNSTKQANYRVGNFVNFPYSIEYDANGINSYQPINALSHSSNIKTTRTTYDTGNNVRVGLIDGVYPIDYLNLQGVPQQNSGNIFWASVDRKSILDDKTVATDVLEIDLGSVKVVNFLMFETLALPVNIKIKYDAFDDPNGETKSYLNVTNEDNFPYEYSLHYDAQNHNPWDQLEYHFTDSLGNLIFTRYITIEFTRKDESSSENPLFYNKNTGEYTPWPIVVRNLRLGRNV